MRSKIKGQETEIQKRVPITEMLQAIRVHVGLSPKFIMTSFGLKQLISNCKKDNHNHNCITAYIGQKCEVSHRQ